VYKRQLLGKPGTVVQLEIRVQGQVVASREMRLHPLMDGVWSVGDGELSTED